MINGATSPAAQPRLRWDGRDTEPLLQRCLELCEADPFVILAVAGAPGAGKSTLAEQLHARLRARFGSAAVLLPLDGYHLAQRVIEARGLGDRKGSPETFDAEAYLALLRALRSGPALTRYAPAFERSIEEPIAAAIEIPAHPRIVVTEGNYLLMDAAPWREALPLFTESWFLDTPEQLRLDQLTRRHERFGLPAEQARSKAPGSDEDNARLIAPSRQRATAVIAVARS